MKMLSYKFILLSSFFILISYACNKEEDDDMKGLDCVDISSANCLEAETPLDLNLTGCSESIFDSTLYCEKIIINDTIKFSEVQKEWMAMYCYTPGDHICYRDSLGNSSSLVITGKRFFLSTHGYNGFDDCEENDELHRLYCITHEWASVNILSEILNLEIQIMMRPEFQYPLFVENSPGASISIRTYPVGSTIIDSQQDFYAIIDKGDLPMMTISNIYYYPEIEILDEEFYNVYSYENVWDSSFTKMYYNKDYGLISFIDQTQNQWVMDIP